VRRRGREVGSPGRFATPGLRALEQGHHIDFDAR
jgi:hypothetical protein